MMKLILVVMILIAKVEAFNIVFLSSFSEDENKFFKVQERINNLIASNLNAQEFNLKIIHKASLIQVWEVLHDDSVDGVIYIGHGGAAMGTVIGNDALIATADNKNISYALQSTYNKKLKFISLISCYSDQVIAAVKNQNPNLYTLAFSSEVGLYNQLDFTIQELYNFFLNNFNNTEREDVLAVGKKIKVKFSRRNLDGANPLVPVMLIAVDKNKKEQTVAMLYNDEEVSVSIPSDTVSLTVDSGDLLIRKTNLGILKVSSGCSLTPIVNKKGKILGVTKNIYQVMCN